MTGVLIPCARPHSFTQSISVIDLDGQALRSVGGCQRPVFLLGERGCFCLRRRLVRHCLSLPRLPPSRRRYRSACIARTSVWQRQAPECVVSPMWSSYIIIRTPDMGQSTVVVYYCKYRHTLTLVPYLVFFLLSIYSTLVTKYIPTLGLRKTDRLKGISAQRETALPPSRAAAELLLALRCLVRVRGTCTGGTVCSPGTPTRLAL